MNHIKKFIDRVSLLDVNSNKNLILSAVDARMLRDEIAKLLADMAIKSTNNTMIDIKGGRW